jgi:hypothetical protein
MDAPKHWQDPLSAMAGVVILVSPWATGYAMAQPALANAVIVGALLLTGAVLAAVVGRPWAECGIAGLGTWLLLSPWVLGFVDAASIRVAVVMGGVVLLLASAALAAEWRSRSRTPVPRP